ncbi:MAG: hypothetical protein RR327_05755 [Clostridia bacterium]
MEKTRNKKLLKRLIITAVIILVVVCLLYIFIIPVRGAPTSEYRSYGEFAKALSKDFIAPNGDLLPNVPSRYEINYLEKNETGGPMIFGARGLFPTTRLYLVYSSSKEGTGYMIIGRRFDKKSLEEEKAKNIPNETINDVAVNVNENGYIFFIDDICYSVKREKNCEIMSMEQLKKVAEDIISQSKK